MSSSTPAAQDSDSFDPPPTSHPTTSDARSSPLSPMPHLFGLEPTSSTSDIRSRPVVRASEVMDMDDYRGLRARTTTRGMGTGFLGALVLTYGLSRFSPRKISPNSLSLIFLRTPTSPLSVPTADKATVSASGISYFSSQALLASELSTIRGKAMARIQPQAESGGPLLPDPDHPDLIPVQAEPNRPTFISAVARIPAQTGRRYAKGKGLEGEVEEESEMRDTYFRPGVPRNER